MKKNAVSRRRSRVACLDALEPRSLLSLFLGSRPTAQVQLDRPRVRPNHAGGITIIQPTPITITGTAQPPADNFETQVEVFALDAQGNVLNGGNPLATATPNFLGLYRVTFRLPSTIRKDINTIVVRQQATGSLAGTQEIDPTTLSGLLGQLAIQGTSITNLEANLGLRPGTLTNLQAALAINGWTGQLDGNILFLPDVIEGTVTNPNLTGSLADGTGNLGERNGTVTGGTGSIAATDGSFAQTGTAAIAPTRGTIRIDVREFAVSDPIPVAIHQSRRQGPPNGNPPTPPDREPPSPPDRPPSIPPDRDPRRRIKISRRGKAGIPCCPGSESGAGRLGSQPGWSRFDPGRSASPPDRPWAGRRNASFDAGPPAAGTGSALIIATVCR